MNYVVFFYLVGVRNRLRVIFIVDCAQPAYETLVETHPAMYKYSDAIWMESWTKKSMMTVAARIVLKYVISLDIYLTFWQHNFQYSSLFRDERAMEELEKTVHIYESLDPSLKCPRRYVSFVNTFSSIFAKKTVGISEQQQRIQVGSYTFPVTCGYITTSNYSDWC